MAFIVDAIKGQSFGAFAHIFKECGEAVSPSVTYADSPSSVTGIGGVGYFVAATSHMEPARVLGAFAASGNPSTVHEGLEGVSSSTATRDGRPGTKAHLAYHLDRPASTPAFPSPERFRSRNGQCDNGQTAKSLSRQIKFHVASIAYFGGIA